MGEGLGLVGSLSLGGPGVGLFACKRSLLRQMPGRLVGQTTDDAGNIGYVLTLSTREQHIRRERATSNICTNHNLIALALSMTLSAYGKKGLINLSKNNFKKTALFRQHLKKYGARIMFDGAHYNETVINLGSQKKLDICMQQAQAHKFIAGVSLAQWYSKLTGCLLVATTELHDDEDIKKLARIVGGQFNE